MCNRKSYNKVIANDSMMQINKVEPQQENEFYGNVTSLLSIEVTWWRRVGEQLCNTVDAGRWGV